MAKHLTELCIENFRGIRKLKLKDFSHVNILSGINNSGKTSILEAILSLSYTQDVKGLYEIAHSRSMDRIGLMEFKWLFNISTNECNINAIIDDKPIGYSVSYNEDIVYFDDLENYIVDNLPNEKDKNSALRALERRFRRFPERLQDEKKQEEVVTYKVRYIGKDENVTIMNCYLTDMIRRVFTSKYLERNISNYNFKCISLGVVDHLSGNIAPNISSSIDNMEKITELLKMFDSKIENVGLTASEKFNYDTNLTIKHQLKGELPISVYGDGIKKIVALADGILGAKDGVLLIDEIETSVHRSILKETMEWLIKACIMYNVQIFLTTHSIELCDTILEISEELKNDLVKEELVSMITLFNKNDDIVIRNLDGKSAFKMREDYDMELR